MARKRHSHHHHHHHHHNQEDEEEEKDEKKMVHIRIKALKVPSVFVGTYVRSYTYFLLTS